ncbi:MAG: amino acid racemase [Candidatus Caldatribacteriota bacterium]|nr:amino acid racemase [Candidatus Caldatribacteriota bacterium]
MVKKEQKLEISGKIIGILGGMGPETTVDLFYRIIKFTPAKKDQEHLRIIIDNNPKIPDRTAAILGVGEDPVAVLQETAKNLEKAGADFIIIPCNTAHYFLPQIQKSVNIPLLNMIEETAKEISRKRNPQIKKVGLLASIGIYETKIYTKHFEKYDIKVISPEKKDKEEVKRIIYAVKAGDLSGNIKNDILNITRKLIDRGAEAIITGCTEIPLILREGDIISQKKRNDLIIIIDPTQVLAKAAIKKAR